MSMNIVKCVRLVTYALVVSAGVLVAGITYAAHSTSISYTVDGLAQTTVTAGDSVSFEIEVTNNGPDPVSEIAISIARVAGGAFIFDSPNLSCDLGGIPGGLGSPTITCSSFSSNLAAGAPYTMSFEATVPSAVGGYLIVAETTGGVGLTHKSINTASLTVNAGASPIVLNAATSEDLDADGYIDAFTLGFSDGSDGSITIDADTLQTTDVSIDGYTVTDIAVADGVPSNVLVTVSELASPNTGDLPSSITVSGISNTDGTELTETELTGEDLVDGARPRMIGGSIAEDGLSASITFSEDINGTTVNGTGSDFSLSTGTITGASETSPGVVGLTFSEAFTGESLTITVGASAISDLSANPTVEHSIEITPVSEEDTTPITISSVGLTTSATSTSAVMAGDTITLTFALGEVASTTSVSIEGSSVTPSVDGTTYTATYTVSESDTAGPVTFSITVADIAGNETTSTSTTNESTLTIVTSEEEEEVSDTVAFSVSLYANDGGLNLISLPVAPADTAIASVLSGISDSIEVVWAYDPLNSDADSSGWLVYYPSNPTISNLTTMTSGYGYWVKVSENTTLTGSGTVIPAGASVPPSRTLAEDWNLVGYYQPTAALTEAVSMDTAFSSAGTAGVDYTALYGFNNQTKVFGTPTEVNPGDAFWMFVVDANAALAPANL